MWLKGFERVLVIRNGVFTGFRGSVQEIRGFGAFSRSLARVLEGLYKVLGVFYHGSTMF